MKTFDAAVLLGAGIAPDGSIPDETIPQLEIALEAFTSGRTTEVITTGSYGYKSNDTFLTTEASAYKSYLVSRGVPEAHIHTEEESKDTMGNIYYTKNNILIPNGWHTLLIAPGPNHSKERVSYILTKILGPEYTWEFLPVPENTLPENIKREHISLTLTKELNDTYVDGDHEAIFQGLVKTHPAYGSNTKYSVEDLKRLLS